MQFRSADLLDKYGFEDGELLEDFLTHHQTEVFDCDRLLLHIVKAYVLPQIDQPILLQLRNTMHNGVRAIAPTGELLTKRETELTPAFVDVDDKVIIEEARRQLATELSTPRAEIYGDLCSIHTAYEAMKLLEFIGLCEEDREVLELLINDDSMPKHLKGTAMALLAMIPK